MAEKDRNGKARATEVLVYYSLESDGHNWMQAAKNWNEIQLNTLGYSLQFPIDFIERTLNFCATITATVGEWKKKYQIKIMWYAHADGEKTKTTPNRKQSLVSNMGIFH